MLLHSLAVACVLALAILSASPVAARSNGLLGYCDLTPTWYPKTGATRQLWPNGLFGRNKTSGADPNVMRWVDAPTYVPEGVMRRQLQRRRS